MYPVNMKRNKQKHKCPECGRIFVTDKPAFCGDYYLVHCECGNTFQSHKICYICNEPINASKKINVCKECAIDCSDCLEEEDIKEAKLLKWI